MTKDLEKNNASSSLFNDLTSAISRHTDDYNLSVARSNPQYSHVEDPSHSLKKDLDPRHVSMIALGGALGTGLLIGTGSALKSAGPGGLLVAYMLIAGIVYLVMAALGEMAAFIPLPGGFTSYAKRYCSSSLGVGVGYVYLIKYLVLPANQLVAGSLVMGYWVDREKVNPGAWIAIFLVIIVAINLLGVRFFGEIEFWLSALKVITCLGLILLLWVIGLGGGPTHDRIGFRFWKNPGAFLEYKDSSKDLHITGSTGRFVAFVSVLVNAVFAFLGTELVGIVFSEAKNPRVAIPKSVKLTLYRIILFYVLNILFLGMCVSPTDPLLLSASGTNASASPFVIAIRNAKIRGLDHVINACILIFVLSAANSDMYIASRTAYGLAIEGFAPKIFSKTSKRGIPYYGVALSFAFCLLGFMTVSSSSAEVFNYFVNVVSLAGLIAWACILVMHVRFMAACKAQGIDRKKFTFYSPFQPYGTYIALFVTCLVILIKNFTVFLGNSFTYKTFITGYIILPFFFIIFIGHMIYRRTKFWTALEIDLDTYRDVIDAEAEAFAKQAAERKAIREAEGNPKNGEWFYQKFLGWIF